MFTISKKLFCSILLGLTLIVVASICSILELSIDHAIIAFVATLIGMVAIFEFIDFDNTGGPSE